MSVEKQVDFIMKMNEELKGVKKDIRELKSKRDIGNLSNRVYQLEKAAESKLREIDVQYLSNRIKGLELEQNQIKDIVDQFHTYLKSVERTTNQSKTFEDYKGQNVMSEIEDLKEVLKVLNGKSNKDEIVETLKVNITDTIHSLQTLVNLLGEFSLLSSLDSNLFKRFMGIQEPKQHLNKAKYQ